MPASRPLSIYIHWPFCQSKCPYCDFNSHVGGAINHEEWLKGYQLELDHFAKNYFQGSNITVKTIFFGGGTPSLMSPSLVAGILEKISKNWAIDDGAEITLEANPTSFEINKFKDFKAAGIERVSIGVQSLVDKDLKQLGRMHNSTGAMEAIQQAGRIFDRVSFDLIYARQGQSLRAWQQELKEAMALAKGHLSLYQLTIEKGTPFYKAHKEGELILPDMDAASDMYEWTRGYMQEHGYERYEISNYASEGQECRHNLAYWHYDEYLGIGPGAHSRLHNNKGTMALMMWHKPDKWLNTVTNKGAGLQTEQVLSKCELIEEIIMMGLRVKEGVDFGNFQSKTGEPLLNILDHNNINLYHQLGLLELTGGHIRLTDKGLMLHSYLVPRLINFGTEPLSPPTS